MTCTGCGSVATLDMGRCFSCDPTEKEVKEFSIMLRLVEVLGPLDDYAQIDRVCSWAASRARHDLEEKRIKQVLEQ